MLTNSLDLAVIGNSTVSALIDKAANWVWACLPRLDGDAIFSKLLHEDTGPLSHGYFAVELQDCVEIKQSYIQHSPMLSTLMTDAQGGVLEVIDFAPRFRQYGRMFAPTSFVRILVRRSGHPRVVVKLRPSAEYGATRPLMTYGSNHIRYLSPDFSYRVTTDASILRILDELPFYVKHSITFILSADETLQGNVHETGRRYYEETEAYWRQWVRSLSIPLEWQEEVIRSAVMLKLSAFEDTGAIIAAMTTSIPEAANSGRNWDYRFCWLRDAYFVVNALNTLGATETLERYMQFIFNLIADSPDGCLQPVYALNGGAELTEYIVPALAGYRGMGPVRVGNQAYEQIQHDVYGAAILGVAHAFFDVRMCDQADEDAFLRIEPLGEKAWQVYDTPDAGIWELRGMKKIHTSSSLMCWAACDRLARIARRLKMAERAELWEARAAKIHAAICDHAWNDRLNCFAAAFGGETLDASVLLMAELDFLPRDDFRLRSTIEVIGRELNKDGFLLRYNEHDDFGYPENAFIVCNFWYIQALSFIGEKQKARELFEKILALRNSFGFLSEDVDPTTGELWGNYPQTYSLVGLIHCATKLSACWDDAF